VKKHIFALVAGLVVLGLVLAACKPTPTPTPTEAPTEAPTEEPTEAPTEEPTEEAVTITIWHGWAGAYLEAIEAAFQRFSDEHPNINVELASVEGLSDALAVASPAGEGPDILAWVQDQIGRNALLGFIHPIDEWVDQAYLEENFEPAAVRAMIWNDQIWGIPESQEGIALVYNADLLTEEDLPDPDDFNDLMEKAAAFREAHPDMYYLCNQGLGNPDAYHVAPIYFGVAGMGPTYGGYIDDQGNAYMNSPEGLAAAEWIAEFTQYAPAETSHEICQAMLTEGQAAIWWTGPWAIADLEAAGFNYGIAPMGSPFVGVKVLMLTQNAVDRGHAEAAIEVMKYFGSAEVQAELALINKTVPASTAALQTPELQNVYAIAAFGESLGRGTPMPNHPFIDCQWGPVGDATTAIWNGSQTPQEAMDAAQAAIEECIAEMQ